MEMTVEVSGLEQLETKMQQLGEDMARRHAIEAVKAGGQVLKAAVASSAREHFQRRTGKLFGNIALNIDVVAGGFSLKDLAKRGGTAKAYVYLKSDAFYGRFWEMGFRHIGRGKKNRAKLRRGQIKGKRMRRRWMGPAAEEAAPRVINAVVNKLKGFFS